MQAIQLVERRQKLAAAFILMGLTIPFPDLPSRVIPHIGRPNPTSLVFFVDYSLEQIRSTGGAISGAGESPERAGRRALATAGGGDRAPPAVF